MLSLQSLPKSLLLRARNQSATTTTTSSSSSFVYRLRHQPRQRLYARTSSLGEGEAVTAVKKVKRKRWKDPERKKAAQDYNNRRASYNRQVSALRRQYADEVAQQRAAEEAEREAMAREATRRRLERQRLKNIRSAQNAIKEEERRQRRAQEFQEHLDREQVRREERNQRFAAARQMVIDELEKEAPLWLTTPEEVEDAFTPEAEQLLWARRGGVVGAPNPSLDAHYWQNETHTWHISKTYKSQRQLLLEQMLELTYEDANIDKDFWTPERIAEVEDLETRARLRAEVRRAGKFELLRRQAQLISEQYETSEGQLPTRIPAPNLKVLANTEALEREGAKLMFADPTKFFVFEGQQDNIMQQVHDASEGEVELEAASEYSGPTLGAPIDIRRSNHEKFPQGIGKDPEPDTRTEREKKQEAREERMLAAARAEEEIDIEAAAEDDEYDDLVPDVDYSNVDWNMADDEEWTRDLRVDSPEDEAIRNVPPEYRYKEEDIDWVLDKLGEQEKFHEKKFGAEVEVLQQSLRSEFEQNAEGGKLEEGSVELILLTMSDKELLVLSDLDDAYAEAGGTMPPREFSEYADQIPSLTDEQIKLLLDRPRE